MVGVDFTKTYKQHIASKIYAMCIILSAQQKQSPAEVDWGLITFLFMISAADVFACVIHVA